MAFRVVVCEVATGVVCDPDGTRYRTTQGPRRDPEFRSLREARAHCRRVRETQPHLECHIYDESGNHRAVFR